MAIIPLKALLQRLYGDGLPIPFSDKAGTRSDLDSWFGASGLVSRPLEFASHRGG